MFDKKGSIESIQTPNNFSEEERKLMLSYLWKIQINRDFAMRYYSDMEDKINALIGQIEERL